MYTFSNYADNDENENASYNVSGNKQLNQMCRKMERIAFLRLGNSLVI